MPHDFWLLEPTALLKYRKFKEQKAVINITNLEAYKEAVKQFQSEDLTIVDETAIIPIRGILSNRASFYSFLFNGSLNTYPFIIKQIQAAEANPKVKKIQVPVDSPGGRVDGLFSLLHTIESLSTPIEALVESRADSAAYGIVSQMDKITAVNEMSEVGSIGVGVSYFTSNNFVDITSTDAPQKWPDVKTEEGVAAVRKELDEIHEQFAGIIAEGRSAATGRNITLKTVNKKFGQGGTMLADSALEVGMIDKIMPQPDRISNAGFFKQSSSDTSSSGIPLNNYSKKDKMNLKDLKAQHPDVYDAVFAEGEAQEKERVSALLELGKETGKLDYAIECVADGKCMTQPTVQAKFLSAKKNKADMDARDEDNAPSVETPKPDADKDAEDVLVKSYLKRRKDKGIT